MTINAFVQSPTKTILKVGKDAQGHEFLEIRERGLWTWFLSKILCLSSYQLETVSDYVKNHYEDLGMDSLEDPQVGIDFYDILNDKIKRYNSHYPNRSISIIEKKVENIATPILKIDPDKFKDNISTPLMKDQNSTSLASPGDTSSEKLSQDSEEFDFTERRKFAKAKVIKNLPPGLKRLRLAWCEDEGGALKDLPSHLEELYLTSSVHCCNALNISNLPGKEIAGLPRGLKKLILDRYSLNDAALKGLPKDLKKLKLILCDFSDAAIQDLHTDLEGLEELAIFRIFALTDAAFKNLPRGLKELTLFNCFQITDAALKNLPTGLKKLNLYGCDKITDTAIKDLLKEREIEVVVPDPISHHLFLI